jgi:GntR family transcriptional regulator
MMVTTKLQKAYSRSRIPLYLQVAAVIRQRVEAGHWARGERIPTLEQLEVEFQVARVTVRQAIDVLRKEDLLYSHQGRGTFITKMNQDKRWLKLATDWQSLAESLKGNVPKQITAAGGAFRPILTDADGRSSEDYVYLRSVQFKDKEPYGIVNLQLARAVYNLDPHAFLSRPALPIIAELKKVAVKTARQSITVSDADPEVADLLQVALGAPIVNCRCIITDEDDVAIYGADIIYRSDCVRLDIDLLAGAQSAKTAAKPDLRVVPKSKR